MRDSSAAPFSRRAVIAGLLFVLTIVPLLVVVPRTVSLAPDVVSAASLEGYSNSAASLVALAWAVSGILLFWLAARTGLVSLPVAQSGTEPEHSPHGPLLPWETTGVLLLILVLYFPLFLARYGPYVEDQVFLTALHRMQGGQRPFVDFEFLYGPLMIYPAHWWTNQFGYSLAAFYAYLAVLELLLYLLLMSVLQHYLPNRKERLIAAILLGVFMFDVLLAPNQNGLRKFLPICAILLVAGRPASIGVVLSGGALLGLQLDYSQDYAVAGLFALLALYGLLALRGGGGRWLARGALVGMSAAVTWFLVAHLLLGEGFATYLSETLDLIRRFSAGEAGFRFYWTVNSLALFGLLGLVCVMTGRGLATPAATPLGSGDNFLFCGLVFALVSLKSGLNRCDLWHLDPAFLMLVVALLLPGPRNLFPLGGRVRNLTRGLIALAAVTYGVGQAPIGSFYLSGWMHGAADVLGGRVPDSLRSVTSRAPSFNLERTHPGRELQQVAAFFADSSRDRRAVLFYGNAWSLGPYVGVYKTDHLNDSFIYSEERGRSLQQFLTDRPTAYVLMERGAYRRLFDLTDSTRALDLRPYFHPTLTKSLASWLSTVHYRAAEVEYGIREGRWKRGVGGYIAARFEMVAEFGGEDGLVVLARRGADSGQR